MTKPTCSFDGCEKAIKAKGLCNSHYMQKRRGVTLSPLAPPPGSVDPEKLFWDKVEKRVDCWNWTGCTEPRGYGHVSVRGRNYMAHRFAWTLEHGPVPDDMFLDHICHNKGCVRPSHLRLATNRQNSEYRAGPNKSNKSSGVRNVKPNGRKWSVVIQAKGQELYFGTFPTINEAEAIAIRERARLFDFKEIHPVRQRTV